MIDLDREEVIVGDAVCRAAEKSGAGGVAIGIERRTAITSGVKVDNGQAARINRHLYRFGPGTSRIRKNAEPSVIVWHDRRGRYRFCFAQAFVAGEEERFILAVVTGVLTFSKGQNDRSTDCEAKLISSERSLAKATGVIEKVRRIQCIIP